MRSPVPYSADAPTREEVDSRAGLLLLDFGTSWCGHCQAAQQPVVQALAAHPGLEHVRIEDGPGRPLGRSFKVRLWPTLILLRDGQEVARLVRPTETAAVAQWLDSGLAAA
jgi:thioredoxin 1